LERRLAAILSLDVVGYSRLIGADETGTLTALRTLRKDLVEPALKRHRGRIVKLMGDGLLAEFASVVDAVSAAVEIQEAMPARSAHLPEDQRIALRIGVNAGDVVVEGGDLFGDGVNVAARLQEIAEPNGVAISEGAHRELSGRLNLPFEDVGEKALKNIKQPVRTWMWSPASQTIELNGPDEPLALPDKPSIAVLPFENMSGDPEQEFFADGMTEDIITGLSKFRGLFVIARNSTFTYKGRAVDVKAVAGDLGVRYVLEGSVRSAGQRIRVTGQLIDAETGNHIWAERYDRDLDDLFAIQDEITAAIVAAIEPEVGAAERERVLRRAPETLDAWGLYQKGLAAYYSSTEESFQTAIDHFDRVNEIDPGFALAFAMGAEARCRYAANWNPEGAEADMLAVAAEKVQRAIALDPRESMCLAADARLRSFQGQDELAITKAHQAVALNPNHALAHHIRGAVLVSAHQPQEALDSFDEAIRLSPNSAFMAGFQMLRAFALAQLERYDEAVVWARLSVHAANPRVIAFYILVASLSELDQMAEAGTVLEQLYARQPDFRISRISELVVRVAGKNFIKALRKAGVPE